MKVFPVNISFALKPLVVAAALAVAGSASAVIAIPSYEYELPLVQQKEFSVEGINFSDSFGFHVSAPSSFSGWLSSTDLNWGILAIKAVNFDSISLSSGSLVSVFSNTGTSHNATFSVASLAAGDYVLTVAGTVVGSVSAISALNGQQIGSYSIYGTLAPVPEPENYAMFLAGLGIIGAMARRKTI
jgi:hypothetical protein